MSTRIQWADETWNPMTGCTPVSAACEHWAQWRKADNLVPGSDYGECAEGCFVHEHDPRDDFGCACFQRRQP